MLSITNCSDLVGRRWKMPPQKNEARCDPPVCNIFYNQQAAAHGQNPGSARRTAANADVSVITPSNRQGRIEREIDKCESKTNGSTRDLSFFLFILLRKIEKKWKKGNCATLIESLCAVLLICMWWRCGATQETHGGIITVWDKHCSIWMPVFEHAWTIKTFLTHILPCFDFFFKNQMFDWWDVSPDFSQGDIILDVWYFNLYQRRCIIMPKVFLANVKLSKYETVSFLTEIFTRQKRPDVHCQNKKHLDVLDSSTLCDVPQTNTASPLSATT